MESDEDFEYLLTMLKETRGFDFTGYKRSTLHRRVRRRMALVNQATFSEYRDFLELQPDEFGLLFDSMLVNVTSFFRDPLAWQALREKVLPDLLSAKSPRAPIRVWSAGCATGEEAYTLAMVLDRYLSSRKGSKLYFGVTATDVSLPALAGGRAGLYPRQKFEEIPSEYSEHYCEALDADSFRIRESLRKRVGFSQFNLLDAVSASMKRLDLIFCQNVLIYFARERRRELLTTLANLLKPGGLLVLGAGEVTNFAHAQLQRIENRNVLAFARIS
jgi:chemotaxis methyl-accepting protein methylase